MDPVVVQPVVIVCWVDLERRVKASERSLWGRGRPWVCSQMDLGLNQAQSADV